MAMKLVFSFGDGKAEGDPTRRDVLGGKGAGLAEMTSLGLPVPPGFTISTDACRSFTSSGEIPAELTPAVEEALAQLEQRVGMRFGDPKAPLLVSVRSGARASMPGMMDTILNLGLNEATAKASRRRPATSASCSTRTAASSRCTRTWRSASSREHFEHALDEARARVAKAKGIDVTRLNAEELRRKVTDADLPREELQGIVAKFKAIVREKTGKDFPEDPKEQLWGAVARGLRSRGPTTAPSSTARCTTSRRAGAPRAMSKRWCSATSATPAPPASRSRATRRPARRSSTASGCRTRRAKTSSPASARRCPSAPRLAKNADDSLEKRMPEAFRALVVDRREAREALPRRAGPGVHDPGGQALHAAVPRPRSGPAAAAVRIAVEMGKEGLLIARRRDPPRRSRRRIDQLLHPTLDPNAPKTLLARGLSASPGAAQGKIVFSADEAERRARPGEAVILVRVETSPEDIHGMKAARGILTARGGMTSPRGRRRARHGQAVRRRLLGARGELPGADRSPSRSTTTTAGRPTRRRSRSGDIITIDGGAGHVYLGAVPTVNASLTGEFARAHGLGRLGARDEGARQRRHPARRAHRARRSAPKASASAAPSTCSSTRSASARCAR